MPTDPSVLVIEDDAETRRLMRRVLEDAGFEVVTEASGQRGLACLAHQPVDCVLVDYRLLDMDGLSCLREIRAGHPHLPAIMVTGAGSQEVAVEAMKLGATDYVVKHRAYLRTVPGIVRAALGRSRLREGHAERARGGRATPAAADEVRERYRRRGIIGDSEALARVVWNADRVARSSVSVLIEGETGTGKELLAQAIHAESPRAGGPFRAQNCAALPESLLESELFGHVRGAFTGAERARPGLFVEADGGTLFLDEVEEMSPAMQAMLLRVLQDGVVRPIGGGAERHVDVRVVAATNRSLEAAERRGAFRSDLLYRLRGFVIRLPPLRERREDVAPLAARFLARWTAIEGVATGGFDPRTLACLASYSWPGNVRELEHEIHRLVLCTDPGRRITPDLLPPEILMAAPQGDDRPLREIVREVEAATIEARLRRHRYHRARTARSLGVTREWLWAKMRKLGLGGRGPDADHDDDEPARERSHEPARDQDEPRRGRHAEHGRARVAAVEETRERTRERVSEHRAGHEPEPDERVVEREAADQRERQHREQASHDEEARERAAKTVAGLVLIDERDGRPADGGGRARDAGDEPGAEEAARGRHDAQPRRADGDAEEHGRADQQIEGAGRQRRKKEGADVRSRDATGERPADGSHVEPDAIPARHQEREREPRDQHRPRHQRRIDQDE